MAFQEPLFFLGLCTVTMIGFILKAVSDKNPEKVNSSEVPLTKLVSQTIFLVVTTILWMIILFRK